MLRSSLLSCRSPTRWSPFLRGAALPVMRGIRPELRGGRRGAGATPRQVWRAIDLPIAGRALLVAAAFAFTISLGEFGATALLARSDWPTLPYAIYRFLRAGSLNYGQSLAMSTLLALTCAVVLLLMERLRFEDEGEL
jgi:thiamine transport system permease protein